MKQHTTNYQNALIVIAEDSSATSGQVPLVKAENPTIAGIQFEMISKNPYKYTSDDVIFAVFAQRKDLAESELEEARDQFYSKGQPCFRASPLPKKYGWGVHSDAQGKIAIYGCETDEYAKLKEDPSIAVYKAMRSSR